MTSTQLTGILAAFGLLTLCIIVVLHLKTEVQIANQKILLIRNCFAELNTNWPFCQASSGS